MDEREEFIRFGKQQIAPAGATLGFLEWLNALYTYVDEHLQNVVSFSLL